MTASSKDSFESWAIVELMGHVRMAGIVTEEERFGVKMGRIDIPKDDGFYTQYFGGGSVYRLSPTTEEIARAVAKHSSPKPVHSYELALPGPVTHNYVSEHPQEDLFDDEEQG